MANQRIVLEEVEVCNMPNDWEITREQPVFIESMCFNDEHFQRITAYENEHGQLRVEGREGGWDEENITSSELASRIEWLRNMLRDHEALQQRIKSHAAAKERRKLNAALGRVNATAADPTRKAARV